MDCVRDAAERVRKEGIAIGVAIVASLTACSDDDRPDWVRNDIPERAYVELPEASDDNVRALLARTQDELVHVDGGTEAEGYHPCTLTDGAITTARPDNFHIECFPD